MSIATTELILYGSAVMPDDDSTSNIGGAIDTAKKIVFSDITPAGTVEMVSSSGSDTTQTVTIYGRNAAGELISEVKTVAGVGVVAFTLTWERIQKVVMSATAVGTITIRKAGAGGDLITMAPGITQVRVPFYNAAIPLTGTTDYYEKMFYKNTNETLTLTLAVVKEYADPLGKITFGLAATLNDTATTTNRLTAPSTIVFDSADKNVVNSQNLTAGAAQGVWLKFSPVSSDSPAKSTYTLEITGQST